VNYGKANDYPTTALRVSARLGDPQHFIEPQYTGRQESARQRAMGRWSRLKGLVLLHKGRAEAALTLAKATQVKMKSPDVR